MPLPDRKREGQTGIHQQRLYCFLGDGDRKGFDAYLQEMSPLELGDLVLVLMEESEDLDIDPRISRIRYGLYEDL